MKRNLECLAVLIGLCGLLSMFNNCSGGFSAMNLVNGSAQSTSVAGSGSTSVTGGSTKYASSSFTGWPLEFIESDLTTAYPNIQYYGRFAVVGGLYPYTFKLLQAPSGMQIQTLTGEIKWTPTQNNTTTNVEVQVTDGTGATLTHTYTINVTTNSFYFIDANAGNDSNSGSISAPFQTLQGVQNANLPNTATLYVNSGTYAAYGINMKNMPGIITANPNDSSRPVFDCQSHGLCFYINSVTDPILFQGLEMTNCSFKYFVLDGNPINNVTWRNNIMDNLTVTNSNNAYENPAFIFTASYSASLGSTATEPPPVYEHIIIQNNQFYNINNYNHDIHASAAIFFDVSHSLEEDNVIHDIYDGSCIEDKEDGWYNTYRNNVCYNDDVYDVNILSQYTGGEDEVNNNLLIGDSNDFSAIQIGLQPGYIRNIYIHNNTIINGITRFGPPFGTANTQNFVIKNNLFYNDGTVNISPFPFYTGNPANFPGAKITANNNLYWSTASQPFLTWNWNGNELDYLGWQNLGFDQNSSFGAKPALSNDGTYSLSPSDPNYGVYGKDFLPGVWQ